VSKVANLAWAYAMLGIRDVPLFEAISSASLTKLRYFSPHDLAYLSWAYAHLGFHDEPLIDALSAAVLRKLPAFSVEDLAKTAWSWATLGVGASEDIVLTCGELASGLTPVSSWNNTEMLDTAHAFVWSAWILGCPGLSWKVFTSWASQGMAVDAASIGLLMMDTASEKHKQREYDLIAVMEKSTAFKDLKAVFSWCRSCFHGDDLNYAMRFDVRVCPGGHHRGTHAKLALLVVDMYDSGASDAPAVLEAIRQHSYGAGQWLKVAGGAKANLIESALRRQQPGKVFVEFGTFVGYTTIRLGQRTGQDVGRKGIALNNAVVVGLEVEPVHVCVARWMVDLAGLSSTVEVWAGMAHDLLLRVGDEFGALSVSLCFMDHRGTKFHEDLARLDGMALMTPYARILADNVLKPSAPVFLWVVNRSRSYSTTNWALGEFVQYNVEDWMVVADYQCPKSECPPVPAALLRLAWESDKWRRKSEADTVRISEWASFAQKTRVVFAQCGLEAKPWLN